MLNNSSKFYLPFAAIISSWHTAARFIGQSKLLHDTQLNHLISCLHHSLFPAHKWGKDSWGRGGGVGCTACFKAD